MNERERIAIRRGQILEALAYETGGMTDVMMKGCLEGRGDVLLMLDVRVELDFLEDKEYIKFIEKKQRLWKVKLAWKGRELLRDELPEDSGIRIIR